MIELMHFMASLDLRIAFYVVWGFGVVIVYGLVLRRGWRKMRAHHDARARREFYARTSRFIVAFASFLAITAALWGLPSDGFRGLLIALALGAFFASGVIELKDEAPDPLVDEDVQGHWWSPRHGHPDDPPTQGR